MKKLTLISLMLISSQFAFAGSTPINKCRQTIILAFESVGKAIEHDDFSTANFSDFGITADEFNTLSPEEQQSIYIKITPLQIMIEQAINTINNNIAYVEGSMYQYFMVEELQQWRSYRDSLRKCLEQ